MAEQTTYIETPVTEVNISGGFESVRIINDQNDIVSVVTQQGIQGEAGPTGAGFPVGGDARQFLNKVDSTDYNAEWSYDYSILDANVKFISSTPTIIASGKVYQGSFEGLGTIYRYISDAKTGLYTTEDSFYQNFDGTNLTNLLATRG